MEQGVPGVVCRSVVEGRRSLSKDEERGLNGTGSKYPY